VPVIKDFDSAYVHMIHHISLAGCIALSIRTMMKWACITFILVCNVARYTSFVTPGGNVASIRSLPNFSSIWQLGIADDGGEDHENTSSSLHQDNDEKISFSEVRDEIKDIPELPRELLVASFILFVSFWPFLALMRLVLPDLLQGQFDIETYMTLRNLMDEPKEIIELPPLSPAEQLVDALFGPNQVDHRGF